MSNSFKAVLALIVLGTIFLSYLSLRSDTEWSIQSSPHQSIDDLKATGNIEIKSFKKWQETHQGGDQFKAWQKQFMEKEPRRTTEVLKTENSSKSQK